jgi:hypothetical protein
MYALPRLFALVCCLFLAPGPTAGAEPPAEQPIKKERLRYDGKSFEQWRDELQTELKPSRRAEALKALEAFANKGYAAEAAAAALDAMGDYDHCYREGQEWAEAAEAADRVFKAAGAAARPVLLRGLKAPNRNRRLYVLRQLSFVEIPFPVVLPAVSALVPDKDADVRARALRYLIEHYPEKGVLPVLARSLKDGDPAVKCTVLEQITRVVTELDDTLMELVLPALSAKEEGVRVAAVDALGEFARRCYFLCNEGEPARAKADRFLKVILHGPKGNAGLLKAMQDRSSEVCLHAVEALAIVDPRTEDVLKALNQASIDPDPAVRKAAAEALGNKDVAPYRFR